MPRSKLKSHRKDKKTYKKKKNINQKINTQRGKKISKNEKQRKKTTKTSTLKSVNKPALLESQNIIITDLNSKNFNRQLGWNCFDIAVKIKRKQLVKYALDKANNKEFRELLAPEIKHAGMLVYTLMVLQKQQKHHEQENIKENTQENIQKIRELLEIFDALSDETDKAQVQDIILAKLKEQESKNQESAESDDLARNALPASMYSEELFNLYKKYQDAHGEMMEAVAACNEKIGKPEGQRLPLEGLNKFFIEEGNRDSHLEAFKAFRKAKKKIFTKHDRNLQIYCENIETYKKYIESYYANNGWVAFQRNCGEVSTSIIDIAARMLNAVIIIYQTKDSEEKEIYRTKNQGNREIEILYKDNCHFEKYNSVFETQKQAEQTSKETSKVETVHQTLSMTNRMKESDQGSSSGFINNDEVNQIAFNLKQAVIEHDDSGKFVRLKFNDHNIVQSFTGLLLQLAIENSSEPGRARKINVNESADEFTVILTLEEFKRIQSHLNEMKQFAEHSPKISSVIDSFDIDEIMPDLNEKLTQRGYLTKLTVEHDNQARNLPKGFSWENIPMLAVVTGKNGVGKTALLEAILNGFGKIMYKKRQVEIKLEFNKKLTADNIPHLLDFSSADNSGHIRYMISRDSAGNYQEEIQDIFEDLKKYDLSKRYGQEHKLKYPKLLHIYKRVISSFEAKNTVSIDLDDFQSKYYEDLKVLLEEDLGVHISTYGSLEKYPKYLLERVPLKNLNDYLREKGFKYIISPKSSRKDDKYILHLQEEDKRETIGGGQLSPGERLQLLSLLWLFEIRINVRSADIGAIFVLDEFDAHLHPELAKEVIDVIKVKLVEEYGVQVIMTTHNPTTISFVPTECLFVMEYESPDLIKPCIRRVKNKQQAISILSGNLVYVNEPFAVVFVEGNTDKQFYTAVTKTLNSANMLNVQMFFKVHGSGSNDEFSSCSRVQSLIEKMTKAENIDDEEPLSQFVFGLIDGDNKEPFKLKNLRKLKRYSVENYIFDPINLFLCLRYICENYHDNDLKIYLENCHRKFIELTNSYELSNKSFEDIIQLNLLQLIIDAFANILRDELERAFKHREDNYSTTIQFIQEHIDLCENIQSGKTSEDNISIILDKLLYDIVAEPKKKYRLLKRYFLLIQELLEQEIEKTNYDIFDFSKFLSLDKKSKLINKNEANRTIKLLSDIKRVFNVTSNELDRKKLVADVLKNIFTVIKDAVKQNSEKKWKKLTSALSERYIKIMNESNTIDWKALENEDAYPILKNKRTDPVNLIYPKFLLYIRGHNLQTIYERIFKIPHKLANDFSYILDAIQCMLIPVELEQIYSSMKTTIEREEIQSKEDKIFTSSGVIPFFKKVKDKSMKTKQFEQNILRDKEAEKAAANKGISDDMVGAGLDLFGTADPDDYYQLEIDEGKQQNKLDSV